MKKENKVYIEEWTTDNNLKDGGEKIRFRKKRKRSISSHANSKISDVNQKSEENIQETSIILSDAYNLTEEEKRKCKNKLS